jgi:hypothetical protein
VQKGRTEGVVIETDRGWLKVYKVVANATLEVKLRRQGR